jgi:hypothetical protein
MTLLLALPALPSECRFSDRNRGCSFIKFLEAFGFLAFSQALQANGAKLSLRLLSIQLGANLVGRMLNLRLDSLIFFAFADCFLANAAFWHGHTHFLELID